MFRVQPESSFGDVIVDELVSEEAGERQWRTFEFAVAWVNGSGAMRIQEPARDFLGSGGCILCTVGLDFGSTSFEGLSVLLDLEVDGANISTHVFFDENRACTFHPKVFLFSNDERARLFVASNNVTGAGLDTNVEAALGISGSLDDVVIRAARHALEGWRDPNREPSRARRLTREFLEELRERRYVLTEAEIRGRRSSENAPGSSPREPLFGRSPSRPRNQRSVTGRRPPDDGTYVEPGVGEVLLMRVRPRRNGQQFQISMRVLEGAFMNGAREVVSIRGVRREIGFNMARGIRNTARFEAPELKHMGVPVARFRWVDSTGSQRAVERVLQYEVFDAATDETGIEILTNLMQGIGSPPETDLELLSEDHTVISIPNQERAQWYRLASD